MFKRIYKALAAVVLPIVLVALGLGGIGLYLQVREACQQRQHAYDAQINYTRFLGHEGKVPDARLNEAIGHLRDFLGQRPSC